MTADFDATVIGAGAVGLACAFALSKRGLSVIVLERETRIGSGVSSRNSEVVHAGLYYPTGSLKARLCVDGRRLLYPFLADHNVAFDRCGKLVVATDESEIPALEKIAKQAEINDVENVSWITGDEARAREPLVRAVRALLCDESGVMDSHGYMSALDGEIKDRGGDVALGSAFIAARPLAGGGFDIEARSAGETVAFSSARLVLAGGLSAQDCAARVDGFPPALIPKRHLGKGNYFALSGLKAPFAMLVYPPPIPGALGTHYRRDLGGAAHFGPDLEWVADENYDVNPARADSFYAAVRKFWPGLPDGALVPDYAGIRPKIHGPGEAQPDFLISDIAAHGLAGLIALFGIESPGLTSSLALGEDVARRLA